MAVNLIVVERVGGIEIVVAVASVVVERVAGTGIVVAVASVVVVERVWGTVAAVVVVEKVGDIVAAAVVGKVRVRDGIGVLDCWAPHQHDHVHHHDPSDLYHQEHDV